MSEQNLSGIEGMRAALERAGNVLHERTESAGGGVFAHEWQMLAMRYADLARLEREQDTSTASMERGVISVTEQRYELYAIDEALRAAGFEHPVGVQGVKDVIRLWEATQAELDAINTTLREAGFLTPDGVGGVRAFADAYARLASDLDIMAAKLAGYVALAQEDNVSAKRVSEAQGTHRPGQMLEDRNGDRWYVAGYARDGQTLLAVAEYHVVWQPDSSTVRAWTFTKVHQKFGPLRWIDMFVHGFDVELDES